MTFLNDYDIINSHQTKGLISLNKKSKILIILTVIVLLVAILFSVIFLPIILKELDSTNQPSSQTVSTFTPNSTPTPITEQTERNANKLYKLFKRYE